MTDTAARPSATPSFSLGDRYSTVSGEILATGVQALTRLPLDQMRADRRAGHNTAAFISGYQGSPLGGYDRELQSQRPLLDELDIVHRPAVNEELGATSVCGSQLSSTFASHRYDGVLGIWYGKSPGVDRAGDAIRHGNFAGTARLRRRAGPGRRRPGLQVLDPPVPLRGDAGRPRARRCSTRARCRTCSTSASTASPCPGPAACGRR